MVANHQWDVVAFTSGPFHRKCKAASPGGQGVKIWYFTWVRKQHPCPWTKSSKWLGNWRLGLTHWGWVMHICISKLTILDLDNGLSPGRCQASHYLNQGWNIVNWILRNKPQWNLNRNSYISIQENVFENIVWKVAAILWHQYVNMNLRVVSYITTSYFVVWLVPVITCDIFWYADPNLPETHRSYDKGNTQLRQHASLKCAAWRTHRCLGSHILHKTHVASWLQEEYSMTPLTHCGLAMS